MPQKLVGISSMFLKVWGNRKTLCMIGTITFFSQKFSVSQCRKLSWESLQCFEIFRESKNIMHNTCYHVFPSKILCLTLPKIFVGIPSMFQKNSGIRKIMYNKGVTFFRRKLSVSQCRKFLWRSPTVFEKVFDSENCLRMKRGAYHIFLSKNLVS